MTVNDEASAGSQRHHRLDYHHIFDRSAIPLWVEDISALRLKLEQLRSRGVTDIRRYAADHPELVRIAAEAIRVVDVNDASLALYGAQSKTELLGPLTATLDLEESQTIEGLTEDLCAIYEGREHTARNGVAVTADGRRIDIAIFSYLPAEPGARDFMLVSVLDITEQRRAERALRESEERFRSVVEQSIGAVIIIGPGERIIFWNAAATTLLGHTAAETIGNHYSLVLPEDAQEEVSEDYTQSTTETRMRAKDGHLIDVEYTRSYWKMGEQSFSTLIVRDITARRRIEARMQEQAQLLDIASDAIIVTDMRRRIRYWNKSAERTYGWTAEEALGQDANELIHEASDSEALAVAFRTTLDTGQWRGEFHHVTKEGRILSGETRWTLVKGDQGRHIGVLSVTTDITERKALEAELLRSQRLESIGTLAGGIAHDLNNVLTPILTGVEALGLLPMDERSKRTLEIIRLSTLRGANIIRQVLSFARGVKGEQGEVQLSHLFREIESIIRETFPKSIELAMTIPADLWVVFGDVTQLHQVLMNICVNARDAMRDGGVLTISAENILLDETYAKMHLDARPGNYVAVKIEDTGMGMGPETMGKIFDPFFTTKETGHGTGLGLSTTRSIVKSHQGFINVYSEVGKGSAFKIYLPASDQGGVEDVDVSEETILKGRDAMVLLADDEPAVREVTQQILESYGFRVLTAQDGIEALSLYVEHKKDIRVVVVDMMMPLLDGPTTIRALRRVNPDVRIVVTSGLLANERAGGLQNLTIEAFLPKPYTAALLLKTIGQVIAADPSG